MYSIDVIQRNYNIGFFESKQNYLATKKKRKKYSKTSKAVFLICLTVKSITTD